MPGKPKTAKRVGLIRAKKSRSLARPDFDAVLTLIESARVKAVASVNTALIELYWNIGEHISRKVTAEEWGRGTVEALSRHIQRRQPAMSGFSSSNLWRMRQFFETYRDDEKLAPLVRELPWSHNLLILGKCKRNEEREFYLRLCLRERWGRRDLDRQIAGALFERTIVSPPKLAPVVREMHPQAAEVFRDAYLVEFLDLPPTHSEADLHRGLVEQLKRFLIELGRDFCFIGSHYQLQVGGRDFTLDLLFFNRALNCLVALELKIDEFQPEHLGKLEFYLEALDRNVRKPHEGPTIGVLLCATKDREVVEYALSRSASPALVAEYQTRLPDKRLLQAKLHEFYALAEQVAPAGPRSRKPIGAKRRPNRESPRKRSTKQAKRKKRTMNSRATNGRRSRAGNSP